MVILCVISSLSLINLYFIKLILFSVLLLSFSNSQIAITDPDEVSVCNLAEMQQSVPSTDDGKSKIVKFIEIFF